MSILSPSLPLSNSLSPIDNCHSPLQSLQTILNSPEFKRMSISTNDAEWRQMKDVEEEVDKAYRDGFNPEPQHNHSMARTETLSVSSHSSSHLASIHHADVECRSSITTTMSPIDIPSSITPSSPINNPIATEIPNLSIKPGYANNQRLLQHIIQLHPLQGTPPSSALSSSPSSVSLPDSLLSPAAMVNGSHSLYTQSPSPPKLPTRPLWLQNKIDASKIAAFTRLHMPVSVRDEKENVIQPTLRIDTESYFSPKWAHSVNLNQPTNEEPLFQSEVVPSFDLIPSPFHILPPSCDDEPIHELGLMRPSSLSSSSSTITSTPSSSPRAASIHSPDPISSILPRTLLDDDHIPFTHMDEFEIAISPSSPKSAHTLLDFADAEDFFQPTNIHSIVTVDYQPTNQVTEEEEFELV